jgi:hypothetical protein
MQLLTTTTLQSWQTWRSCSVVNELLADPQVLTPTADDNYAVRLASTCGHAGIVKLLLADVVDWTTLFAICMFLWICKCCQVVVGRSTSSRFNGHFRHLYMYGPIQYFCDNRHKDTSTLQRSFRSCPKSRIILNMCIQFKICVFSTHTNE